MSDEVLTDEQLLATHEDWLVNIRMNGGNKTKIQHSQSLRAELLRRLAFAASIKAEGRQERGCVFRVGQRVKWQGQEGPVVGTIKHITYTENSGYVLWVGNEELEDFPLCEMEVAAAEEK